MLKNIISQGNFAIWPQISLVLFLLCFTGVLIWVYRRNAGKHYDDMANIVFDESGPHTEDTHGGR